MNATLRFTRSLSKSAVGISIRKKLNSAFSSKYLLLTNVTLSTLSSLGGDALAQTVENYGEECKTPFSWTRNLKVGATGTLVGPMYHYWYIFLDRILPGRTGRVILSKVVLDMSIAPPINIFLYIGSLGLMDGEQWSKIKRDMLEKGKDLWLAECIVWPPASAVAFYILPTKFRVLSESSLSLIVDCYYSFVRFRDDQQQDKAKTEVTLSKREVESTTKVLANGPIKENALVSPNRTEKNELKRTIS